MKNLKFIAEVSSNHNQSLSRCLEFVDQSAEAGFYAIKFQLFKIEELFSKEILDKSKVHRDRKKWEFKKEFLSPIFERCKKKKIKLSCTPFYLEAVDILNRYVDFFKISSYELTWKELIKKCLQKKKPTIISTGMATEFEIKTLLSFLSPNEKKKISLLHCVSEYPARLENCNLKSIDLMRKKFRCNVGWSDHTKNPLLIFDLIENFNINLFEFHVDLDDKKGKEYKAGHCWTFSEITSLINYFKNRKKIHGTFQKKPSKSEISERLWRADPGDGLRPFKHIRKKFKK